MIGGLTLGPSGFPFYGSDTGGYRHAPPTKETFIRWFQQTALSTVMQVGTNSNDAPWEGGVDDSFDDGAFGGGPGDENPMTQVRRRSSAALSYYSSAARMHCVTAPLASPVRSRRWCRTSRTTRRSS